MITYDFTAKDKEGKSVTDKIQAKTRYEAISQLTGRGLAVISLNDILKRPVKNKKDTAVSTCKTNNLLSRKRITSIELSVFCRQLSLCISSGLNIIESLESISDDIENNYFKEVLFQVRDDIGKGAFLSEALSKYEHVFSSLFVALMRSAEESGSLHTVLQYMSLYLENSVRLERKIRSITAYPMFVAGFFLIVVMVATFFILPRFESLFSGFGSQLPMISRVVFATNRFILDNLLYFVAIFILTIISIAVFYRTDNGRYRVDAFKFKIPLFGNIIKKSSIARFCRILSVTLKGGVPIIKAIDITCKVSNNMMFEQSLAAVRKDIIEGMNIANSLKKSGNFPRLVERMVRVGEASGKLPDVLNNVADMYEDDVDGSITVMVSLFEPIIIILFGVVVLVLALAIYVPVFNISMAMKGGV